MRFARKMLLLVVAAAAVMALAAPTASATSTIEVTKGDGATHCPTIAAGGCAVHAEGEITMFFHIIGFEGVEARCHVEYRGKTDEDGLGEITAQTVTPGKHDADCKDATATACSLPWPGAAEKDAGGITAHYDVCIDPAESGICSGEYVTAVTESGTTTEVQKQDAADQTLGTSFCEFTVVDETSEAVAPEGEETHIKSI